MFYRRSEENRKNIVAAREREISEKMKAQKLADDNASRRMEEKKRWVRKKTCFEFISNPFCDEGSCFSSLYANTSLLFQEAQEREQEAALQDIRRARRTQSIEHAQVVLFMSWYISCYVLNFISQPNLCMLCGLA